MKYISCPRTAIAIFAYMARTPFIHAIIISALFFVSCLMSIEYVGLSHDGAVVGLWGLNILEDTNVALESPHGFTVCDAFFPTAYRDYTFALPSYMIIPFFLLFGINLLSLKLLAIFVVWLSLIMLYYALRQLFNSRVAFLTCVLLSLSATFAHFTRIENHSTEPIINFFCIGAVFFYIHYVRRKANVFLYATALFLGLGLNIKLSMFSRIAGLCAVILMLYRQETIRCIRATGLKTIAVALIFFIAGGFLFFHYNIQSKGGTFALVRFLLPQPEGVGHNTFKKTLNRRVEQGIAFLKEDLSKEDSFPAPAERYSWLYFGEFNACRNALLIFFAVAFFYNLVNACTERDKKVLTVYLLLCVLAGSTLFSPGSVQMFHLSLLYPFPQLINALFIDGLASQVERSRIRGWLRNCAYGVPVGAVGFLVTFNVAAMVAYHSVYLVTGGSSIWSGYVTELTDYIRANDLYPIYTLDWGLRHTITLFTYGKMQEYKGIEDFHIHAQKKSKRPAAWNAALQEVVSTQHIRYFIVFNYYREQLNALSEYAGRTHKKLAHVKTFHNRIGEKVFSIYTLE